MFCATCGTLIERYRQQVDNSKSGRFFCADCSTSAPRKPSTRVTFICALPDCNVELEVVPSSKRKYCSTAHSTQHRWIRIGHVQESRICELGDCPVSFDVRPSNPKRFCCSDHARLSRIERERRLCPGCGQWFEAVPSRMGEYHSRACRNAHLQIKRQCLHCGKDFTCSASQVKNGGGKYCCDEHRIAGRRTNAIDRWHNGKPVVTMTSKSKNSVRTYLKVWQPDHPRAHVTGWVMEHVYEACLKYGRTIGLDEHVHHVDRDGMNNSWGNLVVLSHVEHARLTAMENAERAAAADDYLKALAEADRFRNDLEALRRRVTELEADLATQGSTPIVDGPATVT